MITIDSGDRCKEFLINESQDKDKEKRLIIEHDFSDRTKSILYYWDYQLTN